MVTETQSQESIVDVVFRSKQGQMLLLMAFMYTVIVGITLSVFFFTTGGVITLIVSCVYILFTSVLVYTRTPAPQLIPAAFFLFAIVPVIASWVIIGVGLLVF